ncbi:bacitracin ABC transporter ATP-binding protein [Finegoldia magna]|uniref:ATP-binding cassette domain-containing protein n=2 Tax=Peptoniphilaceae TaxID=1570339 RepID=A0A3E2TJ12_9FIRM|nr:MULTISPECIES: ATP-binding cassette domain-containing protein [Peptoniphilaceae]MDU4277903.1 ATP-binding cassette domain-containing protein [Finegoldia magna]OXZ31127.1 bacitracin ABC transporter ATP-binding protein [Finegoldia magna]OXZ37377.1 bacitracin ABC transporter ATP-binding protein [Finegoldia magna]RGB75943.1 ATP-binding cassette domain-containing protein [Anaerococcus nagyae]
MKDEVLIEIKNLTKKYKNSTALDNVNLRILKGKVYGFVGKNGAGKTTLIRMITGLAFPSTGEIYIFGNKEQEDLQNARRKIGALVEGPTLYPFMTAKENLRSQQIQKGINDEHEIEEILKLVNLENTGKKKARNFSLGMKQRLGIGLSLVGNPDFLIWDEPINGLDPEGIKQIRELINHLNTNLNKTILISSHILEELENTVTDFILIDKGKIIETITKEELSKLKTESIYINTSDNEKTINIFKEKFPNIEINKENEFVCIKNFNDNIDLLSSLLADNKIQIREMKKERESLEDYVFERIGRM